MRFDSLTGFKEGCGQDLAFDSLTGFKECSGQSISKWLTGAEHCPAPRALYHYHSLNQPPTLFALCLNLPFYCSLVHALPCRCMHALCQCLVFEVSYSNGDKANLGSINMWMVHTSNGT